MTNILIAVSLVVLAVVQSVRALVALASYYRAERSAGALLRSQRQLADAAMTALSHSRDLPVFRVTQHDDHFHVLSPDGSFVGDRCDTEEQATEIASMLNARTSMGKH